MQRYREKEADLRLSKVPHTQTISAMRITKKVIHVAFAIKVAVVLNSVFPSRNARNGEQINEIRDQ
jgi:hypothetical protein